MFTLTIDTDHDVFHCDDGTEDSAARSECARILREVADTLEGYPNSFLFFTTLRDVDGNDVGRAKLVTQRNETPRHYARRAK